MHLCVTFVNIKCRRFVFGQMRLSTFLYKRAGFYDFCWKNWKFMLKNGKKLNNFYKNFQFFMHSCGFPCMKRERERGVGKGILGPWTLSATYFSKCRSALLNLWTSKILADIENDEKVEVDCGWVRLLFINDHSISYRTLMHITR